jgi:protein phosphatase
MSTTLTLAYLAESKILTAWCGDSRIYHFRNGNVLWRSEDHSMVSMLVKTGEISESEAENHPQKNIILRSINANSKPSDIETHWLTDIQTGDYLLLCTDGVLEQMNDERFKSILKNENSDKRILFLNYCEGKTSDNFSLYLIKLKTDKPNIVNIKNKNNQLVVTIGILIAVILVLMLFFLLPSKNPKTSLPKRDTSINTKPQSKVQKHKESDVVIPK